MSANKGEDNSRGMPLAVPKLRDLAVIGFGLTLAVLLVGGVLGFVNARRLTENERMVAHTHEVIGELKALLSTLTDAETGQRGYLLTEEDKYLKPYEDALRRVQAIVTHLKELMMDNADQQAQLAVLEQKITVRLDELKRTVALINGKNRPAAVEIVRTDTGKAMIEDIRERVAAMRRAEEDLLRRRAEESEASSRTTVVSVFLPAIIGVILVCVMFYLSQRNLLIRQRAAQELAEQKERLRTTLASIGDAVISTDTEGRITNMNAVAESLTEWKKEEATGQQLDTVFRIVNEKTRQPVHNPAKKAMSEGVILGLANHTVLITKGGNELPIDDSAAPIRCAKGEIVGCVLVFRDVTERRRAERSARLLASIVESADDAIISKDVNGIITSWNQGAERIFGYTAAEAVGRPIAMLAPPERADEMPGILQRIKRGERVDHFDTLRRMKDGRLVTISLTVSPIKDKDGWIVGASKIARDISERKRAEEALREADRRKDEFLAMLAHELRNPLAPIRNAVQFLQMKGPDESKLQKARDIIDRQAQHMSRLVDDLLDVSRISRGKINLQKQQTSLSAILTNAIEVSRPLIEAKGHELTMKLPPEPVYLQADTTRLAQVFLNLLNNAAKYTEPGGHIWLTAERQGSDAVVKVKDNGTGIAADKLPMLFGMFSQVEGSLSRSQGGLGIGLHLVKRLVEMHGGSVVAHSEGQGKGSEFIVRLPVLVGTAVPLAPTKEDEPAVPKSSLRTLIVDDDRDAADSLGMMLRLMGNEVRTAYDGEEAVAAAGEFRPDVVLLDIGLPRLNGYEACRRIREQPWGKNMVLIAVTGWGQEEDRRLSHEAGFDKHMVKPVDPQGLMKLLGELCGVKAS